MTTPARPLALAALGIATLGCSAPDSPTPIPAVKPAAAATAVAPEKPSEAPPTEGDAVAGTSAKGKQGAKRRYVVAAMGDSLTDPRSHGGKYLEYLAARCPESRFDSYGKGGNMVNQMRRRFLRDVFGEGDGESPPAERPSSGGAPAGSVEAKPRYTHVIVLGGINDILSDETALRTNEQIEDDLGWMYREAKTRGAAVIALTLPPWAGFEKWYNPRRGASTEEVNRWIKQQHREGNVDLLLDVYPLMSCGDPTFLCPKYGWPDQVHWSAAGHDAVGRALHEHIFSDCL